MSETGLKQATDKMREAGLPDVAVDTFAHYYERLEGGETGMLPEADIEPVTELQRADDLPDPGDDGRAALDKAIVLKLNGGLGTSMGMTQPKSLIEAKDGLTFLDIIVRQILDLREKHGARLPLVLMNSFATRDSTLEALDKYDDIETGDVPIDFVQGKVPKLLADDLTPATWEANPDQEWAPPGHGDIYTSLVTSGMLEKLLDAGYEYAFISNSDNLGAVLEPKILAWFAREELPFAMEVAQRTEADRKGGHLAKRPASDGGGLLLRETAQTPDEDLEKLQDISRHRYVNTNNLWVNLTSLKATLDERDGVLGLPMIVNRKTVDPSDKSSPKVIQLESAMGAAIGVFEGAAGIHVSRRRFAPVKTTDDLLAVRSDAYVLTESSEVQLSPKRDEPPFVDLDDDYYKLLADFEERFPKGAPSLVEAERLVVEGDVTFGAGVVVRGAVKLEGPTSVDDDAVLEG